MKSRSGIFFVNPRSGSAAGASESDLRRAAAEYGLELVSIEPSLDCAAAVRGALERGERNFIVGGGDGSIHHIAQSVVGTDGVLGIVPLGTVNHLAKDLGMPLDWRAALDVAARAGIEQQIDVGRANGRYFLNTMMMGLYPTISRYREKFRSTHSKWVAYSKGARMALRTMHHAKLVLDIDGKLETLVTPMFVLSVNAYDLTQPGAVLFRTSFSDARLTIYTVGEMSRYQFMRAAAKYLRGRISDVAGFRMIRAKKLRVDSGHHHMRVSMDGEPVELTPPIQIDVVPSALLVRRPNGE